MKNIFKNKKILITGGTGSIGSAIVETLLKKDCNTIRVLENDENGLYNLSLKINKKKKNRFFYINEEKEYSFYLWKYYRL